MQCVANKCTVVATFGLQEMKHYHYRGQTRQVVQWQYGKQGEREREKALKLMAVQEVKFISNKTLLWME